MSRPHAVPSVVLALLMAAAVAQASPAKPARSTARGALPPRVAEAPAPDTTAAPVAVAAQRPQAPATSDSAMILRGGQEGTVFRTLTVEGEDRVHVDFARPALDLDLDPARVPGLDRGTARDVLDRTLPDLVTPLLSVSTGGSSPYLARPWLGQFGSGAVVRFRPETREVARWKLTIVDSRGQTVRTFEGRGNPPQELAWDGRAADGSAVVPGLTYSHAFEAYDRAGNRRNVVGQGFGVAAYRFDTPEGPVLIFSGRLLDSDGRARADAPPTIVLEAASWLAQGPTSHAPVRVTAVARSYEQASGLAARVVRDLGAFTPGDPARLQTVTKVEPDAPEDGVIRIAPASVK